MDLDFTEEQQMVIDMTRSMLAEYSTTAVVRDMEDDPKGYPDALWKQMSELGLNGLTIPESYGGGGQTLLEAAQLVVDCGNVVVIRHLPEYCPVLPRWSIAALPSGIIAAQCSSRL